MHVIFLLSSVVESKVCRQDTSLSGVSAISGATITSTAYRGCVETAFEAFELVKEAQK